MQIKKTISGIQTLILVFLVSSSLIVSINYLYHPIENKSVLDDEIKPINETNQLLGTDSSISSSGSSSVESQIITTENYLDQPTKSEEESYYSEPIDTDQWHEGESVKITHLFSQQKADLVDTYPQLDVASISYLGGIQRTYESDDLYQELYCDVETDCDDPYPNRHPSLDYWGSGLSFLYSIPALTTGTLYVEGFAIYQSDYSGGTNYSTTEQVHSLPISTDHVSTQGYMKVLVSAYEWDHYYNYQWDEGAIFTIHVWDFNHDVWDMVVEDGTHWTYAPANNFNYLYLLVDEIYYQPTTINSNIRSSYKYASSTNIVHRLHFENFDYGNTIRIYAPLSWELTSIIPSSFVSFSYSSDYWSITNTLPSLYEIEFLSGVGFGVDYDRQSQYLAISDHSLDYMQNPSFEGGSWSDDWSQSSDPIYQFDSIEKDTSIVFNGAFSLKLTDASGYSSSYSALPDGEYYYSFSYYIETLTSGSLRSYNWNGAWEYVDRDTTTNRWVTVFDHIKIDGESEGNFKPIYFYNVVGAVIYFDNFFIGHSNARMTTTAYGETVSSAQLISLDAYEKPAKLNEKVTMQLRDRCDNELIKEWVLVTDDQGFVSVIFRGTLEQKEYSLFVVANSADAYNPLDFDSSDFSLTDRSPTLQGDTEIFTQEGIGGAAYFDGTGDYVDYTSSFLAAGADEYTFSIWFKTDTTTADRHCILESTIDWAISIELTTSHYINAYASTTATHGAVTSAVAYNDDAWHHVGVTYTEGGAFNLYVDGELKDSDTTMTGDLDATPSLHLGTYRSANARFFEGYLDEFRFYEEAFSEDEIQGIYNLNNPNTKSYFTPQVVGSLDYAETELSNAWDFTEETDDGFTGETFTVENGYIQAEHTSTWIDFVSSSFNTIDRAYWTHCSFRYYSNTTARSVYLKNSNGGDWVVIASTTIGWNVFEYSLDINHWAWQQDYSNFQIYFKDNSLGAAKIRLDYLSLLHKDSSLSGGYMQEFEEEGYTDGWTSWGGALTSEYGNLVFTSASTSYIELRLDFPSHISASDYDRFELALCSNVNDLYLTSLKDWGYSNLYTTSHTLSSSNWIVISGEFGASWSGNEEGLRVVIDEEGGDGNPESSDIVYMAYFRFLSSSPHNLYETPSSYFMSSENDTLEYQVFNDYQARGSYQDLKLINLNLTVASHSFSYVAYNDLDEVGCYLPSSFYYTEYIINEDDFIVSVESFTLSDSYANLFLTATKDGTYQYFHDSILQGSGSFSKEGTALNLARDVTAGLEYELEIVFTNSSDTVSFTVTISNAATVFYDLDCTVKTWDQLGRFINPDNFVIELDSSRVGSQFLWSNTSATYNLTISDFWGNILYTNATETFESVKDFTFSLYECVLVNLVDEDVKGQIKPSSSSTWFALTIPEGSWRYIYLYTGTYDIRFIDLGDNVLLLYTSQNIATDVIYEAKHYPDLIVYSYDYSWAEGGNVTLDVFTNYEDVNVTVWEDSVLIGTWTTPANISWLTSNVNGSHLVIFEISRWINKVVNVTQSFDYWFSYSIGIENTLQSSLIWFENEANLNLSITANTNSAIVYIFHDNVLVTSANLTRNYLITKNTGAGLHNLTITIAYYYNASLAFYNHYKITYWVSDYYTQALRFATTVEGFNLDNSHIDLAYLAVYLDGVFIEPQAPEWWYDQLEETEEINRSSIFNDWAWIRNTGRNHTLTICDLWGEIIATFTLDLASGSFVTYSLPLYKLIIDNDDLEDHGFKLSWYNTTSGSYVSLDIIPIVAGSTKEFWIRDGDYAVRSYDFVNETYDEHGQEIEFVGDWEYTDDTIPCFFSPTDDDGDVKYGWITISFTEHITDPDTVEKETTSDQGMSLILWLLIGIFVVLIGLCVLIYRYYRKHGDSRLTATGKALHPFREGQNIAIDEGSSAAVRGGEWVGKKVDKRF